MVKLSAISKQETRPVAIDFGDGDVLNLTIDPSAITLAWTDRTAELTKNPDIVAIADHFFIAVKDWDLTDEEGTVLPLDDSTIGALPVGVFLHIMSHLGDSLAPKAEIAS